MREKQNTPISEYATRFVSNVFYGFLSQIMHFLISAFLIGYLVRRLGPELWGLVVVATSVTSLMALVQLGASAGIGKRLNTFIVQGRDAEFTQYFSAANLVCGVMSFLLFVLTLLLLIFYWSALNISAEYSTEGKAVFASMGLTVIVSTLNLPIIACLQARHRIDINAKLNMIALILRAGACVFLFELFGPSAFIYALIIFFAKLFVYLGEMIWLRGNIHIAKLKLSTVTWGIVNSLIRFNLLTFFNSVNYAIFLQVPALLLQKFVGLTSAGLYGISQQVTILSRSFMVVGLNAIQPVAISLESSSQRSKIIELFRLSSKVYICAGLLLWFFMFFLGESFLTLWLSRDVSELIEAFPWLMASAAMGIMALPSAAFTIALEKLRLAGIGGLILSIIMITVMLFGLETVAASPLLWAAKLLFCFFGFYQLLRTWVVVHNLKITLRVFAVDFCCRPIFAMMLPLIYLFWISSQFGQIKNIIHFILICLIFLVVSIPSFLFMLLNKRDWSIIKQVFTGSLRKKKNEV